MPRFKTLILPVKAKSEFEEEELAVVQESDGSYRLYYRPKGEAEPKIVIPKR